MAEAFGLPSFLVDGLSLSSPLHSFHYTIILLIPLLLISLYQTQNGADYCFDTVAVIISDSVGAVSLSHTLVPRLSGTAVNVELVSGLEQDTHFTASLFFNSQRIATTNFCECLQCVWLDVELACNFGVIIVHFL